MKFVIFCVLTGYIGFVNGLCFSNHGAAFPLPCRSHQKGNSYSLLAIKLAELLCFSFFSLTRGKRLEGDENI